MAFDRNCQNSYISLLILVNSEAFSNISSLSIMLKLVALSSGIFFASILQEC